MFITFEGGEGSGKTTQAQTLVARMKKEGYSAVLVQEPGSTPLGMQLRRWLKQYDDMTPNTEALLFAAARAELVEREIRPNLKRGVIVVSDRYADSMVAYQAFGRKLKLELVVSMNQLATVGLWPNLTFLLDIEPKSALARLGSTEFPLKSDNNTRSRLRWDQENERRFEREDNEFHSRVREGYLHLAALEPDRWMLLNASESAASLTERIWTRTLRLLRVSGVS